MRDVLRAEWARRPWWMSVLGLFCLYMTIVYVPWDLLWKPVHQDHEVWFGYVFRGWAAKLTTPLHWMIYAFGSYGFWRMRPWMHPWAALYLLQVGFSMGVWAATASPILAPALIQAGFQS